MTAYRRFRGTAASVALALLMAVPGTIARASAPEECDEQCQIDRARAATEKYWDSSVAARDGFVETGGCTSSAAGTLAIQWSHPARITGQTLAVDAPTSLLYVPQGNLGGRRLVGVEYSAPVEEGQERPELFGRSFSGPEPSRIPALPERYVLRVWLFSDNPDGLFADANPAEACDVDTLVDRHAAAEGCFEVFGIISVLEEAVRDPEIGNVPTRFGLQPGMRPGHVQINVGSFFCERLVLADGTVEEPVLFGHYTAALRPPDYAGADLFDSRYLLRGIFSTQLAADTVRERMGVGSDVVVHTSEIERDFAPVLGIGDPAYRFRSPDYEVHAAVVEGAPFGTDGTVRFLRETPDGIASYRVWVRVDFSPASVVVTPRPGSLLARLTGCADDAASCAPIEADSGSVVRFDDAALRFKAGGQG